jgi:hypothetical protein
MREGGRGRQEGKALLATYLPPITYRLFERRFLDT